MNVQIQNQTVLAHSGHSQTTDSDKEQQEIDKKQPPVTPNAEVNTDSSLSTEETPVSETNSSTTSASILGQTSSSPLPGLGEFILLLLVAAPFLMFSIKRWMHK